MSKPILKSTVIKYKFAVIQELKDIGFKFQHSTIKDFFEYAAEFVDENEDDLMEILLKWHNPDLDDFITDDPNEDMDLTFNYILHAAEKRIKRINDTGVIEFEDYFKVVHPVYKNNPDVIKSVWEDRKIKYAIDTLTILDYPKPFGLSQKQANQFTLLNELYRLIIINLDSFDMFKPFPENESSYRDEINRLESELYDVISSEAKSKKKKPTSFMKKQRIEYLLKNAKESEYEEMFNKYRSVKEKAANIVLKVCTPPKHIDYINQTTSIENKELVIREYLKEQTPAIKLSRNSQGKGIHKAKEARIKKYIKKYPDKNNSEVARALKVNRKTVRKYRTG